jgi:hypothetical protein
MNMILNRQGRQGRQEKLFSRIKTWHSYQVSYLPGTRRSVMRTIIIILGGFLLLAVCIGAARWFGGEVTMGTAVKVFIPVWLVLVGVNMWIGVARAGYSVAEELPIFLLIFSLPAAVALFIWWKFSQ